MFHILNCTELLKLKKDLKTELPRKKNHQGLNSGGNELLIFNLNGDTTLNY